MRPRLARATVVSLTPTPFEVPAAWLRSTRFCLPGRAAWIIWSMVRSPWVRNRWQKRNVRSWMISAFW